jgi:transcription antitermination factor NusG
MAIGEIALSESVAGLSPFRWYALHLRSRHEKVVEQALQGKGYPVLCPFYTVKRKRSDRTVEVEVPLFPGYLFCHFDALDRLPILKTSGVVSVVGIGGAPQPVEDLEIRSIQTIVASGRQVQPWPLLRQGQKVRIQAGPLCGAEGTLLQVRSKCRLVVLVSVLQRAVAVELDQDTVAPLF